MSQNTSNDSEYADWPRSEIRPLAVGNTQTQDATGVEAFETRKSHALWITIDLDAVPGLRDVFERQRAGHDFDVVTRWGAAVPEEEGDTPYALLDVVLPEVRIAFEILLAVDEYKRSLLTAVRSGLVLLCEPSLIQALQVEPPEQAWPKHLSMAFRVEDATAVVALLEQRFELPLQSYEPQAHTISEGDQKAVLESFLEGAALPSAMAIEPRPDGAPVIVLVDPAVAELRARLSAGAVVEGRWAALLGDKHAIVRFDAFADGGKLGSWVVPEPSEELVRAGSVGHHVVVLLPERLSEVAAEAERQWQEALHIRVQHVEAFRALLR